MKNNKLIFTLLLSITVNVVFGQSTFKFVQKIPTRILVVHIMEEELDDEAIKKEYILKDKHFSESTVKSEEKFNANYNKAMKKFMNTDNWHHNDSIVFLDAKGIKNLKDKNKYIILTKKGLNKDDFLARRNPEQEFKLVLGEKIGRMDKAGSYNIATLQKWNMPVFESWYGIEHGSEMGLVGYSRLNDILAVINATSGISDSSSKKEIPTIWQYEFEVILAIRMFNYSLKEGRRLDEVNWKEKMKNRKIPKGKIYSLTSSLDFSSYKTGNFNEIKKGTYSQIAEDNKGLILVSMKEYFVSSSSSMNYNSTSGSWNNNTSYSSGYITRYIIVDFYTGKIYFTTRISADKENKEKEFIKRALDHK